MLTRRRGHPGTAAVLSFVFNGLGQLYNGQIQKGLLLIAVSALSIFVFIIGSIFIGFWLWGKVIFCRQLFWGLVLFLLGMISVCWLGIYSIFDAYKEAQKK